ncbi:MAG: divergent polysaccharide deacetylase family protein [Alphaproteobacteria bacterium]|nr:divergent polysaccharide deacetylase family protein [Alphaproteobacteria bacterium]
MREERAQRGRRRINLPLVIALAIVAGLSGMVFGAWWQEREQAARAKLDETARGARISVVLPLPQPEPASRPEARLPAQPAPPSPAAPPAEPTVPAAPPATTAEQQQETPARQVQAPPAPARDARPAPAPSPPPPSAPKVERGTEPAKPDEILALARPPVPPRPMMPEPQPGPIGPLPPVPDPALVQPGPYGPLPVIAPDGRQAWQVYARPFDRADPRPRIAILIGDLGFSVSASNAAIERLPQGVTLAFAPYAEDLQNWIGKARLHGHEVMLQLPMEPLDYPTNDPGPRALLTSLGADDNMRRLEWMLGRFSGYVGVTNYMGSKFTTSAADMRPILEALRDRGLLFVDSRSSQRSVAWSVARELRMAHAANNRFIDNEASRLSIDARLEELERIARDHGTALGIGYPYPVTIERVAAWAAQLERKGLLLAPVSAVVQPPAASN